MNLILTNIKELVQTETTPRRWVAGADMAQLPTIKNAFLIIRNGLIAEFGTMEEYRQLDSRFYNGIDEMDVSGRMVFPCFADSHTHLVYAGSREQEFVDRIKGKTYEEIAAAGGGILNSAKRLQETSEEELYQSAMIRLHEVINLGTGAIEIKSGYGLTVKDELKILRVVKRLKALNLIEIKATFLGAHAIPKEYQDRKEYIDLIVNEMIPQVAAEGLADYCDVFCDKGFFTPEETDRILKAGLAYGLRPKIHANQLSASGGIQVGVANNAISVDHLEHVGEAEIAALKTSETMPTLLPGAAFFLGLPYQPARKMIEAGLPLALASDYNPGSCPSGSIPLILSLACIKLKMLPEEAINAVTINSAYAMGLEKTHGSIAKGKVGNVFITQEIPSYAYMPYAFGSDTIDKVIIKGKIFREAQPLLNNWFV
ncbi:imidazolonepropionase [Adhaeribacter soli]|uniref:Imidazolonepropionase n=1 Tax=Adhaeribacter soli TaxID=2607655 RepID=A0A5N1J4Y7_9BACT|nr:imidazolonepropionase [Adhaeribacter soli]KAA9345787.1 imidazolonepropionase [Adhaeribacter soli]